MNGNPVTTTVCKKQIYVVVVLNRNLQVTYANKKFYDLTRLNENDVLFQHYFQLNGTFEHRQLNGNTLLEVDTELCELITFKQNDGSIMELQATVLPILVDNDKVSHFVIVYQDITNQSEMNVYNFHYLDPLTKLQNRKRFEEDVEVELQLTKGNPTSNCAIFFIDLDRFKFFNDTLGFAVGDLLINKVANELAALESKFVTLYRFGGDEFIFLMRNFNSESEIHHLASSVLKIFKQPFVIHNQELLLTASIGISMCPKLAKESKTLMEQAMTALQFVKERGKDTYQIFDYHMSTAYADRLQMEMQLRKALESEEFSLYYQPQICLKTKKIIGVEALIRWRNKELGFVPPNQFIPLAEESGIIDQIGDWVLKTACFQMKTWQEKHGIYIRVGINISPKQFQRPDFVSNVQKVLKETGLEAKYVDLEITENGLMQNTLQCIRTLQQLKEIGLKISIDDFGTGYSSLSYLKRFPIDTLKIDQSFVRELMDDTNDQAIVTSIINLAHNMKLKVIAEGVETIEIVQFLNRHKCDEMQGYLYSKPLSSSQFEEFLGNLELHSRSLNFV